MEKTIEKKPGMVIVRASMIPRVSTERKLRFYVEDAKEYVLKTFPNIGEIIADDLSNSITISNYNEPYSGEWCFLVEDPSKEIYKEMADKFEENQLKDQEESAKIQERSNKKISKKRKENE